MSIKKQELNIHDASCAVCGATPAAEGYRLLNEVEQALVDEYVQGLKEAYSGGNWCSFPHPTAEVETLWLELPGLSYCELHRRPEQV